MSRSVTGAQAPSHEAAFSTEPNAVVQTIVVAGDVQVNWLMEKGVDWLAQSATPRDGNSPEGRLYTWQQRPGIRFEAMEGGAMLLAKQVGLATTGTGWPANILTYDTQNLRNTPPHEILQCVIELAPMEEVPGERKSARVLRVSRFAGYNAGEKGAPAPLTLARDDASAAIVVIDDSGNGFSQASEVWPAALVARDAQPTVVLRTNRPTENGGLLDKLRASHLDRLVVIADADDLRASGISISRRLSWERTARDFLWQMQYNPELAALRELPNFVIRFGVEGTIHFSADGVNPEASLFYDPLISEDGFSDRCRGDMVGVPETFVAALTARVAREGLIGVREGIRDGLRSMRRLRRRGFGRDPRKLALPGAELFAPASPGDDSIVDVRIPVSPSRDSADPDFWSILSDVEAEGLERVAHQLVISGETTALRNVPVGVFGGLRTVDRSEIESFRSIQNLIGEYLARPRTKRPLCIAVFGPPGSGKSFGVEQVAKSVGRMSDAIVEKLEFNLSQFETTRDLTGALHRVRDKVLEGIVPLVFFDEFDCSFNGQLGWLRYFLAPMQDGSFRDGDAIHPIGKSIFVFAGGLSATFSQFTREEISEDLSPADRHALLARFKEAKGPDFASRLRGYVNILGPNPQSASDRLYLIRRAMVLRSLLQRNWSSIIDPQNPSVLNVDEGVLRALIGVPVYKHGIRSLESVLEMSLLEGQRAFEPAALPAQKQLEQHVDATAFARLVLQGVLFTAAREAIAEAIHRQYRRDRPADGSTDERLRPWSELADIYKRSNRGQAADIIRKLESVKCSYRPRSDTKQAEFEFSKEEIELLAELEHERWMRDKLDEGYSYAPERDEDRKTHPGLVEWSELSEEMKRVDRDTVEGIPQFMADAGFEVYRM